MDNESRIDRDALKYALEDATFPLPTYDIMAPISNDATIAENFQKQVAHVQEQASKWEEWALNEILYLRDRIQDLETELMLVQADFEPTLNNIKPKRRSNF